MGWSFQVYDSVVTADIGNNVKFEHSFKFYAVGYGGVEKFREIYDYTVYYHWKSIENFEYVEEQERCGRYYCGYRATNGESYFVLKVGNSLNEDGSISNYLEQNKEHLEHYYDILSPFFERIEEMDYDKITSDGEKVRLLHYGISIDKLSEILSKKE